MQYFAVCRLRQKAFRLGNYLGNCHNRCKHHHAKQMTGAAVPALNAVCPATSRILSKSIELALQGLNPVMDLGYMDKMSGMMASCIGHAYEMGLSDDQIRKIKPVHSAIQKKQAQFVADLKIAEIELMETLEVKKFDLESANNAVNHIAEITKIHHLAMLKAINEMRAMFSDQQFNEINSMAPLKER